MVKRKAIYSELNNLIDDPFDIAFSSYYLDTSSIKSFDVIDFELVPVSDDWYGVADYVLKADDAIKNFNNPYSPPWF